MKEASDDISKQIENITSIAAQLVIDGKATQEDAIQKALQYDSEMCEKMLLEIHRGQTRPRIDSDSKERKGIEIVKRSVYNRLRTK
jgi:hypothetical protein